MKKVLLGLLSAVVLLIGTGCSNIGGSEKPGYRGDMGADVPAEAYVTPKFKTGQVVSYFNSDSKVQNYYLFDSSVKGKVIQTIKVDDAVTASKRGSIYTTASFDYDEFTGRVTSTTDQGTMFYGQFIQVEEETQVIDSKASVIFVAESDEYGLYQTYYPLLAGVNASFKFKTPKKVDFFNGEETLECDYVFTDDGYIKLTKKKYEGEIWLKFYDNGTLLYINNKAWPLYSEVTCREGDVALSLGLSTNLDVDGNGEVNYLEKFFKENPSLTSVKTIALNYYEKDWVNLESVASVIKNNPGYNFKFGLVDAFMLGKDGKTSVIPESCFEGIENLTSVRLASLYVNTIDKKAFKDCTGLKIVSIDTNNKYFYIKPEAFKGCSALAELKLYSKKAWVDSDTSEEIVPAGSGEDDYEKNAKKITGDYADAYWYYNPY